MYSTLLMVLRHILASAVLIRNKYLTIKVKFNTFYNLLHLLKANNILPKFQNVSTHLFPNTIKRSKFASIDWQEGMLTLKISNWFSSIEYQGKFIRRIYFQNQSTIPPQREDFCLVISSFAQQHICSKNRQHLSIYNLLSTFSVNSPIFYHQLQKSKGRCCKPAYLFADTSRITKEQLIFPLKNCISYSLDCYFVFAK